MQVESLKSAKMPIFRIKKQKEKKKFLEWSKSEDKLLLKLTKNNPRKNWLLISQSIGTKSIDRCKYRYLQIDPKFKRGKWTKEEDERLFRLVQKYGRCWTLLASIIKKRSGKQIRSRYVNYIFKGINKEKFSQEEDKIIIENYPFFKNKWIQYCPILPNRSPRHVENRVKYLLKKRQIKEFSAESELVYLYSSHESGQTSFSL